MRALSWSFLVALFTLATCSRPQDEFSNLAPAANGGPAEASDKQAAPEGPAEASDKQAAPEGPAEASDKQAAPDGPGEASDQASPSAEAHESPAAAANDQISSDAKQHHEDQADPEAKLEKLETYVASKGLLLTHIEAVEEKVVDATQAARKWKDSKQGVAEAAKELEEASQRAAKIQKEGLVALVKESPKTAQTAVVAAA